MNERTAPGEDGFGLALGGGFVRGLAHLGVLSALEAEGLSPGWLAGTSSGAIAAAFAAFGVSAAAAADALAELGWGTMTRAAPFRKLGVATNEGLESIVRAALGDVALEEAGIPLGVVATDINTGQRVLLREGSAARAVRASCCVPGLYAPVEMDGRLLVDGALVENVPARAVREMGAPVVVAVSLGFGLPFAEVTSLRQVVANAFDIAVNSQMRFEILSEADVLIDPDVTRFSKVRAPDRQALVEAGRCRTVEAIPALREALEAVEGTAVSRWMREVRDRLAALRP
jgi:NTE family protein